MKRYGNLYAKIVDYDNLVLAEANARNGKKHTIGVRIFDRNPEGNLRKLHESLINHTYTTSTYRVSKIWEPKERLIYKLPYYPDRIVHHAIMNVLKPIWTPMFISQTYSCIENRGINACRRDVRRAVRHNYEGAKYCLKMDIRKFYQSIDTEVLKAILRRKIKDVDLLLLFDDIIDSVYKPVKLGDNVTEGDVPVFGGGLPIGNYLSQYFANLYLTYFDHWLKEKKAVKYYFRYADDMVILGDDKAALHRLRAEIDTYLRKELHLELKPNWQVFPIARSHSDKSGRPIDFVGYLFYHNETWLRKSIKLRFRRKVAYVAKRAHRLSVEKAVKKLSPWIGWLKWCDSGRLRERVLTTLNSQIYEKIQSYFKREAGCPCAAY